MVIIMVVLAISLGGCGCFWQQMKDEVPPPASPPTAFVHPEQKAEVPMTAAVSPLQGINFDFDRYDIREGDAAAILRENLNWFQAQENRGKKVRVEGRCDERGTVGYNLVFGQKRADTTKSFLVNFGADGRLTDTVNYGMERPLDPGHNEEAWARNRKAQLLSLQ